MGTADHRNSMRSARSASILLASLVAALVAVPAAGASQPGDTEHGVNRAKLAAKAERVTEERNGIDVLKISKCGPRKRSGKLDYSKWICMWRAEGVYPGEVPYHCAGKAVWKRKGNRWRVDRCENRLQPMAPLLDTVGPPPVFGFNDNWLTQSVAAVDLLQDSGAAVARTGLPWSWVESPRGSLQLDEHRPALQPPARPRHQAPVGAGRRPLLRPARPRRVYGRREEPAADRPVLRRDGGVRRRRRAALSGLGGLRGLERAQLPEVLGRQGARPRRVLGHAEDGRRRPPQPGSRDDGGQRRALPARRHGHQRLDRLPRLPDQDVRARRRPAGRRDRHPPLPRGRARGRLPRRRPGLPRQGPERDGPLRRRRPAAVGD